MHVDRARAAVVVAAPDAAQQHLAGVRATGVRHEEREQGVLEVGEVDRLAVQVRLVGGEVEREVVDANSSCLVTSSPGHSRLRTRTASSSDDAPRTRKSLWTRTGSRASWSPSGSIEHEQPQVRPAGGGVLDDLPERVRAAPAVEDDQADVAVEQLLLHLARRALGGLHVEGADGVRHPRAWCASRRRR